MNFMWIKIPTHLDLDRDEEPEIHVFPGNDQGPEMGWELTEGEDCIDFAKRVGRKKQAKFTTLLLCHDHASPGCVRYYKKGVGWVTVC